VTGWRRESRCWNYEITGRPSWKVAVVLGSGLGEVAESLVSEGSADFSDISALPQTAVEGHPGRLHYGDVGGVPTLVFAGRIHLYEGHEASDVTVLVRSAVEAGCDRVVLTNAAGGIKGELEVGAPVLIRDHLNLTGHNPLRGPHDNRGPRFLDMIDAYDKELRRIAKEIDPSLREGVYAGLAGPTYETPAEIAMLEKLGADMVGMSTVLETIEARYLGAKVLGISLITNQAAGLKDEPLSHDEVAEAGRAAGPRLGRLLRELIPRMG
jgi:purine-nucleoside phosphorylase